MSHSETAKLWQDRLRRFVASQSTVTQFCQNEGVSQPSFYKWKKKLRQPPIVAASKRTGSIVQFMPLRLATEPVNQVAPKADQQASPSLACTTIELPGGIRIRVEVPTDLQQVQHWEARA